MSSRLRRCRLGESIGGNQAAKRLGIPESSLWNWMQAEPCGQAQGSRWQCGAGEAIGYRKSRRRIPGCVEELASTKLDLEIVKKAAAYFAKESR